VVVVLELVAQYKVTLVVLMLVIQLAEAEVVLVALE
jgi:hypothetical protein